MKFPVDFDNCRGEYIFLLDRSGSMSNERIEKAKEALILFLKSLPVSTYFNVCSYGSNYELMFSESKPAITENIQEALKLIEQISANMCGNEEYKVLQYIFSLKQIKGQPR